VVLFLAVAPGIAGAHGERNLESFVRMRGVTFLDVQFSTDRLAVNETMTIRGKFRLMRSWPRELKLPELAYLNVLVPGPRLGVVARRLNGQFVQNSFHIEPGKLYDFELTLRARDPGTWHVHPLVNLSGTGSMVGPGRWVTVVPGSGPPTFPVTLAATGETIDLETFGLGRVVLWHGLFLVLGGAWLLYWIRKPILVRYVLLSRGVDQEQFTPLDRKVTAIVAAVTIVVVAAGLAFTATGRPVTIPHQVQDTWELPEVPVPSAVETTVKEFSYDPARRTVALVVQATNRSERPVLLRKFATAYISFVADHSLDLAPKPEGWIPSFEVEPKGPIAPGETRILTLRLEDAVWQTERLVDYDQPQVTAAGLLVFVDPEGGAEGSEPVLVRHDREMPELPWSRVASVNEVFGDLRLRFPARAG
jgi:methane/ammonia monooxygenase subunit B